MLLLIIGRSIINYGIHYLEARVTRCEIIYLFGHFHIWNSLTKYCINDNVTLLLTWQIPITLKSLHLTQSALEVLLKRDSFCAAEVEIFLAVQMWCEANQCSASQHQKILQLVRLSLMTLDDLLGVVRPSGLVSADDILDTIKAQRDAKNLDLPYRGFLSRSKESSWTPERSVYLDRNIFLQFRMKTWPRPSTGQKSFLGFRKVLCWMATIPTTTWIRVSPCTTLTVQGKDRKAIRRVESWWHSTVPTSSTTLGCCSGTKTRGFASLHSWTRVFEFRCDMCG